jgi:hypothetical protein
VAVGTAERAFKGSNQVKGLGTGEVGITKPVKARGRRIGRRRAGCGRLDGNVLGGGTLSELAGLEVRAVIEETREVSHKIREGNGWELPILCLGYTDALVDGVEGKMVGPLAHTLGQAHFEGNGGEGESTCGQLFMDGGEAWVREGMLSCCL